MAVMASLKALCCVTLLPLSLRLNMDQSVDHLDLDLQVLCGFEVHPRSGPDPDPGSPGSVDPDPGNPVGLPVKVLKMENG